jgi:hypothetical protein
MVMRLCPAAAFTAGEVGGRVRGFFKVTYRKHVFKRRKPMKLDRRGPKQLDEQGLLGERKVVTRIRRMPWVGVGVVITSFFGVGAGAGGSE